MNKQQRGWNNLYNEGGEGYIPSAKSEAEQIAKEVAAMIARQTMTQAEKDAENKTRQDAYLAAEKKEQEALRRNYSKL